MQDGHNHAKNSSNKAKHTTTEYWAFWKNWNIALKASQLKTTGSCYHLSLYSLEKLSATKHVSVSKAQHDQ